MAVDRELEQAMDGEVMREAVMAAISSRRATRKFRTDVGVTDEQLHSILQAARWASSASDRRIHTFLIVRNPTAIQLLRSVSPGIAGNPPVLIVICTDMERARAAEVQLERDTTTWIDVGTAAMNMMVAAHALGLGSCPATSFSRGGVSEILELPPTANPEFILQLGYAEADQQSMRRPSRRLAVRDIAYLERYGEPVPW